MVKNLKSITFLPAGELKRLIILGAGQLAVAAAEFARGTGIEAVVIGGPRQSEARLSDGRSVADALRALETTIDYAKSIRASKYNPHKAEFQGAVILSLGSPFIISGALIERFEGRVINSHGAPLPEWRGGGGFSWRIMAGDRRGNSCFHLVTAGIDDGPVVYEHAYEFGPDLRTPAAYTDYAVARARTCLGELLAGIAEGREFPLRQQDEAAATYFPRLDSRRQGYIDWSWPGTAIERFILAFSRPYDGAKTFAGAATVRIYDAIFEAGGGHPFFAGLVTGATGGELRIACLDGHVRVSRSEIESDAALRLGDRLVTPAEHLEAALKLRPRYTPEGLRG